MKSSRRKQTNPNRVAAGPRDLELLATPRLPDSDAPATLEEGGRDIVDRMEEGNSTHSEQSLTNDQGPDYELPIDMHVSLIPCPHCSETFPNARVLQEHREEVHGSEPKKARIEVNPEDFPTAYHRLGRELQEITDLPLTNGHIDTDLSPVPLVSATTPSPRGTPQSTKLPLPAGHVEESFTEPPQSLPLSTSATKVSKENAGEPINGKSDRIFHMDAYCELCDREFCNKYFLKTHKANKHGIYEDISPPASSVPLPFPGLLIPQDPLASFNFKMDSMKPPPSEPHMPWSFKLDSPNQQNKKADSSPGMKSVDPSLPLFPMPLPSLESPKPFTTKTGSNGSNGNASSGSPASSSIISSSATSILTSITNSIKSGSSSSNSVPPPNDPSMEDYCHICQKHFCNKYYLKKHKQDVHGIAPENPPNISGKRARSSLLDLPMTSNNHMMLHQPLVSLAGMHSLPGMPGLPSMANMSNMSNMPPGVMVINPYSLPPVAIIPAGSLMPGQQLPPPPHPIISQPMSITSLPEPSLLPPAPPTTASSGSSSNSAGHSPNKFSSSLQEGGVHCNICSKEFCNEFYLHMHKESKHGFRRGSEDGYRERALPLIKEGKYDCGRSSPPPLNSTSKYESPRVPSRSPVDHCSGETSFYVCNLCSKEFSNKYLYRIHRIHDHGLNELIDPTLMENGELPNKEAAMRSMNESLMRMAADASAVGYASSFGSPPSNKPQETAVCDICNKEIANQYFLRVHKFNVHGLDPASNEKYDRKPMSSPVPPNSKPKTPPTSGSLPNSLSQQSLPLPVHPAGKPHMLPFLPPKIDFKDMPPFADFSRDFKSFRDMPSFLTDTINNELFARSQNPIRQMDLNFFGLPSLGKLPGEDSVKLNFDPEAYCDICKKEFCSKYFLRTHKQNIHGIKSDTTSSVSSKSSDNEKITPASPSKINMNNMNGTMKEGTEKSSWRWKEPVNSSRVVCDICNKEVCNKYFLRTHKQKKHGIPPSSQSPNVSISGSPVASDCDTASNASSQPDEKPFRLDPFSLPQMIPLPPSERLSEKFNLKPLNFGKGKEDVPLNNNIEQCETCNICNRRFKNLKWLKEHIVKDHRDTEALDMRSKGSPPIYTCQVCGADFPAELSVQLHLIQEHNARVTLDTDEPQIPTEEASLPNGEGNKVAELSGRWGLRKKVSNHRRLKKYVCARCGFDTHWLSSLLDHERNEHGVVSEPAPAYSCKQCQQLLASLNSLSAHMVTVHGFTIEDALQEVKCAEPEAPNSFRCSHCSAVFPTRSWGMAHVRHVHIRSRRDLAIKNFFEKSLLRCPSCSFKTHFAFRLQRHVKCRHRNSLRSGLRASRPICPSRSLIASSMRKASDIPSPASGSREDSSLVSSSAAMYKSIAASLLSAPESGRVESPNGSVEREDVLMHSYKLPLASSPVDSSPFKMAAQTSTASAVLGL